MNNFSDLPKTIPVFPLQGVLLLPHTKLPLNIFEPRYITMIDDALKTENRLIGMVQPREMPSGNDDACLQHIGCAGRITSFSETEDGRYMITLSGLSRFRVSNTHEGFSPYLTADVDWTSFKADRGIGKDCRCSHCDTRSKPSIFDTNRAPTGCTRQTGAQPT